MMSSARCPNSETGGGPKRPASPPRPRAAQRRRQHGAGRAHAKGSAVPLESDAEGIMPWRRRPDWLYLPHLFDDAQGGSENYPNSGGTPMVGEERLRDQSATSDRGTDMDTEHGAELRDDSKCDADGPEGEETPCSGAGQSRSFNADSADAIDGAPGPIRGRGISPGAETTSVARDSGAAISGPLLEPGPRALGRSRSSAQARLEEKNAHLRISLEAHAERVARKRSQNDGQGGQPTAAERMEALRRRLAAKIANVRLPKERSTGQCNGGDAAAATHGDAGEEPRETSADGTEEREQAGAAEPETGTATSAYGPPKRKELYKIHFAVNCMEGIRDDPAWEAPGSESRNGERAERDSASAAVVEQRCPAADPEREANAAAAVTDAASRVAWHSNVA